MASKSELLAEIDALQAELTIQDQKGRKVGAELIRLRDAERRRKLADDMAAEREAAQKRQKRLHELSEGVIRLADEDADVALVYNKTGQPEVEIVLRLGERESKILAAFVTGERDEPAPDYAAAARSILSMAPTTFRNHAAVAF